MIKNNCLTCNKIFETYQSRIKVGKGKFCSKNCANNSRIGKQTWNKGKKGLQKWTPKKYSQMIKFMTGNSFAKGKNLGNTNGFKKGFTPWNKGIKMPEISNDKSYNWKGNKVSYSGIHHWVKRHRGKAKKCEFCAKTGDGKKIQWANIDHFYSRNLNDFISLCVSCHRKFDIKYNNHISA